MDAVKVQSVDSLRVLRAALCKFADAAKAVLSEVDGELQRAVNWLQTEADSHWQGQIRSRQAGVVKAKDALRAKKLFHADGFRPSVVDEEKAVRLAIARLQEAEAKLVAVHKYAVVLQKEVMQYKGQVQRFTNMVMIDIPIAVGKLDALLRNLETYLGLKADEVEAEEGLRVQGSGFSEGTTEEGRGSMVRPEAGGGEGEKGGRGDGETEGQRENRTSGVTPPSPPLSKGGEPVPPGPPLERGGGESGSSGSSGGPAIPNPQSEIRNSEGGG